MERTKLDGNEHVRSNVSDQSQIVSFLDRVGVQVRETSLGGECVRFSKITYSTSGEHITVIAVQTTSLLGDRTGGNVQDTGQEFSSNLEPSCNFPEEIRTCQESSASNPESR